MHVVREGVQICVGGDGGVVVVVVSVWAFSVCMSTSP